MECRYTGTIHCTHCGNVNVYENEEVFLLDGDYLAMKCKQCGEVVAP